jgi:hypothetical protein
MAGTEHRESVEERARRLLVQFKGDLQALMQKDEYAEAGGVVLVGMVQVFTGMGRRAVRADPSALQPLQQALRGADDDLQRAVHADDRPIGPVH